VDEDEDEYEEAVVNEQPRSMRRSRCLEMTRPEEAREDEDKRWKRDHVNL